MAQRDSEKLSLGTINILLFGLAKIPSCLEKRGLKGLGGRSLAISASLVWEPAMRALSEQLAQQGNPLSL